MCAGAHVAANRVHVRVPEQNISLGEKYYDKGFAEAFISTDKAL